MNPAFGPQYRHNAARAADSKFSLLSQDRKSLLLQCPVGVTLGGTERCISRSDNKNVPDCVPLTAEFAFGSPQFPPAVPVPARELASACDDESEVGYQRPLARSRLPPPDS